MFMNEGKDDVYTFFTSEPSLIRLVVKSMQVQGGSDCKVLELSCSFTVWTPDEHACFICSSVCFFVMVSIAASYMSVLYNAAK